MSIRKERRNRSLVRTALSGVTLALGLLVTTAVRAEIIPVAEMMRGIHMTAAQCAAKADTVWVTVYGRSLCVRYYISSAGGEGTRPVVYLQGDKLGSYDVKTRTFKVNPNEPDVDTDKIAAWIAGLSKLTKTTAIYLARIGVDGSSGFHGERKTLLELHAVNAALEAIKRRHHFVGFNLVGQSGGSKLVGGLLGVRSDIACAVPGAAPLDTKNGRPPSDPALAYFNASDFVAVIARNHSARILVVTDPADSRVAVEQQISFVRKLRRAGGQAEQFFVQALDPTHHGVARYAYQVVSECMRGTSTEEISVKLARAVEKTLTRAHAAKTNAPQAPAPLPQPVHDRAAQPAAPGSTQQ